MHRKYACLIRTSNTIPACKIAVALAASLGILLGSAAVSAQVLPTGSTVDGKTIGEWGAEFWTFLLSHPAALAPLGDEPLTDLTGEHQADDSHDLGDSLLAGRSIDSRADRPTL